MPLRSSARSFMAESLTEVVSGNDNPTTSDLIGKPEDAERQEVQEDPRSEKASAVNGLGWLDRLLAIWVFLAMTTGIILGNFVPNAGSVLQKGKFAGVSVPIGWSL